MHPILNTYSYTHENISLIRVCIMTNAYMVVYTYLVLLYRFLSIGAVLTLSTNVHCTVYSLRCTMYTSVRCTVYIAHSLESWLNIYVYVVLAVMHLYNVHYALYNGHSKYILAITT